MRSDVYMCATIDKLSSCLLFPSFFYCSIARATIVCVLRVCMCLDVCECTRLVRFTVTNRVHFSKRSFLYLLFSCLLAVYLGKERMAFSILSEPSLLSYQKWFKSVCVSVRLCRARHGPAHTCTHIQELTHMTTFAHMHIATLACILHFFMGTGQTN